LGRSGFFFLDALQDDDDDDDGNDNDNDAAVALDTVVLGVRIELVMMTDLDKGSFSASDDFGSVCSEADGEDNDGDKVDFTLEGGNDDAEELIRFMDKDEFTGLLMILSFAFCDLFVTAWDFPPDFDLPCVCDLFEKLNSDNDGAVAVGKCCVFFWLDESSLNFCLICDDDRAILLEGFT